MVHVGTVERKLRKERVPQNSRSGQRSMQLLGLALPPLRFKSCVGEVDPSPPESQPFRISLPRVPKAKLCRKRSSYLYLLAFLLSARPSCQNAKKRGRAAADQATTTTVAAAVNSRAPTQPTHIALALRSETSPTFVPAWQRNSSANNGALCI